MSLMNDLFVRGYAFSAATGEKTGANLEDLATRAYPTVASEIVDQVMLETYSDSGVVDDGGNPINRIRIKDGSITQAKLASAAVTALAAPAGTVIQFAGATAPTGYLECNGAAVSRTTYATLFAVVGVAFGEGNGSTTFNVPDLRGRFVRGWDHAAGNDPDAATRTAMATGGATGDNVGSVQADDYKSHTHQVAVTGNDTVGLLPYLRSNNPTTPKTTTASPTTGGNETRPKNANLMMCIKT